MYKKSKKRIPRRNNFIVVFASKFRCINLYATWGTTGVYICTSSVAYCKTCTEEPVVTGSTFDGGWGMRWWQDVDGGAENDGWAVDVGEDGKVAVYGDVTVDINGSWMLDGSWNFIWDDFGVTVKEDVEVGEVMSLIGLADGIWSEVVLSVRKNLGERVMMQSMFVILVEQSEN